MQGFDPEFTDLTDYILKITAKIWEEKQVESIRRYYADDVVVCSPEGLAHGADAVVTATYATQAAMPDRRLLGEAVVWCEDDVGGYLSSHRILSLASYQTAGGYGPATGQQLRYRVIADCWVKTNQVYEEWLVRDQSAIARGLGYSPRELAQLQIDESDNSFLSEQDYFSGIYQPVLSADVDAQNYLRLAKSIWQDADLNRIGDRYGEAAHVVAPGGHDKHGHRQIKQMLANYLAALNDLSFTVHDLTDLSAAHCKTVAMRWSVTARSTGTGAWSGARADTPIFIMGISQARFENGQIVQEWILFDEVAIWKQLIVA